MNLKKLSVSIALIFIALFITSNSFAANKSPHVYSPSVMLVEPETGTILYKKKIYDKKYPASTTKIMTALVVLENCKLDDKVIISENAVDMLKGTRVCYCSFSAWRRI